MFTTYRTGRIFLNGIFPELHLPGIQREQSPDQRFTAPDNQFDDFIGLDRTDHSGYHTNHTGFSTRRNRTGSGWIGIQTAITGAFSGIENTCQPIEPVNGTVNIRFPEQDTSIIDEIA